MIASKDFVFKTFAEGEGLLAGVHWAEHPSKGPDARPIVIVLHGGGFVIGSKDMVPKAQIDALARLGFVVVVPNYRLCPQISVFDGPVTDTKDALAWCRAKLPGLLEAEGRVLADPKRVVAMGHSAGGGLALLLGTVEEPVNAILDFYGSKYYNSAVLGAPSPYFANAPTLPDEYIQRVYEGPQVSTAPPFRPGIDSGPPPPRNAWMLATMKDGTWLDKVVQDGNLTRIDAASGFSASFPPTMFVHGTGDTAVDCKTSLRAFEDLKRLGVEVDILLPEGQQHMFDVTLGFEDEMFKEYVLKGFNFLKKHV